MAERMCSRCRERPKRAYHAWCQPCGNEYSRLNRKPYRDLSDEERRRSNCRAYTWVLIRRGHLTRGPCERCGGSDAQAHHDDFDKPREVRWVCAPCWTPRREKPAPDPGAELFERWTGEGTKT